MGGEDPFIESVINQLAESYSDLKGVNSEERVRLPSDQEVNSIITELFELLFPGYSGTRLYATRSMRYALADALTKLYEQLNKIVGRVLLHACENQNSHHCSDCDINRITEEKVQSFLNKLAGIREMVKLDIVAAFEGDPAAKSHDEVLVSYPGLRAVAVQRLAHELYLLNIPLIPRMMTEYVHGKTGIDIHPGATLGKGIFIDHGTGVVIGETAILKDGVKIYQGVTLGALSFPKDEKGNIIRGEKRHPTLGNHVTIYSGATILGDINIGDGSVIGGNVWLTHSVEPYSKITNKS